MKSTDIVDFLQDEDGDLVIPLQHAAGVQAAKQGIRDRLLLFKGEWFLNLDVGVPWFQRILGKKFVEAIARSEIRAAILSYPAVADVPVLDLTFDRADRKLSVAFEARLVFDDLTTTLKDSLDLEAA
jgi:hypothetical protein